MRQTLVLWVALAGLPLSTDLLAQRTEQLDHPPHPATAPALVMGIVGAEPTRQDDPGYELYKQGYTLILQEDWNGAQVVLDELIVRHPRSEYVDDAYYWSAYALKHTNRETAAKLYREFTRKYRESSYYDDAVADLKELESVVIIKPPKGHPVPIPREVIESHAFVVAPSVKKLEREVRRATRAYRRIGIRAGPEGMPTVVRIASSPSRSIVFE